MFAQPEREAGGLRVRFLTPGGAAAAAGIQASDVIVAVDGKPVIDPANPRRLGVISDLKANQKVELTVERAGQRVTLDFTMGAESHKPWIVKPDAGATAEQVALREAWLAGREGAAEGKRGKPGFGGADK
jgi:C-terminal processing protease CtpA/Prc